MPKKRFALHTSKGRTEMDVATIESALKELAQQAKRGELEFPCRVEFEHGGATFTIEINNAEAAQEISTLGFMY